jgi:response regulator of citrate/malate metabolism
METECMTVRQRELDRLRVLHEIKRKHLTQLEAARRLQLSERQIRRLLVGLASRGDRAQIHGLRGRPSNRRLAPGWERKILTWVRERYADFGPTLAAEHLAQEGLRVSRETLRQWMVIRMSVARTRN